MSEIAKIFDPLGLLGPIILFTKKLMQNLWRLKLEWDESIPLEIHSQWLKFCTQLNHMNDISIPRLIVLPGFKEIEIHGFCDASLTGYGACIYIFEPKIIIISIQLHFYVLNHA